MAAGNCHHFTYTPSELGWGGVWWQSPDGKPGDEPGVTIPEGATQISFTAWGAEGGELLSFGSGYGVADGFAVKLGAVELTTEPQTFTIDIAGVPYQDIAGALYWVTEAGDQAQEIFIWITCSSSTRPPRSTLAPSLARPQEQLKTAQRLIM